MINDRAVEKIARHVEDAVAKGAKVLTGGRLPDLGPTYYAPTVLSGATASMACACEETFGPVAPLTVFDDEAEVIAAANDTPFGLAAYFYSQDIRRIWRVADALESGIVGINEGALAAEAALWRRQGVRLRPRRLDPRARRLPAHQIRLPGGLD
jgi:succinate-semialdehyde dehydrogenase/glutarate-semialdehyde dehydrogenase